MSYSMDLEFVSAVCPVSIVAEQVTSGSLNRTPGVRLEASECNCFENSESVPIVGCTDNMTWLEW